MDYHCRPNRRPSAPAACARALPRLWQPPKYSLFMAVIVVGVALVFIQPATSQQHSSSLLLNTPPILYVPERNWRISETEQVGQIIARIRAEDAENDELVFGLEPHFHANYANPSDDDDGGLARDKLPFRIDPVRGVVYLNESLIGRGGENFFLYITVSDGQLTAKNEVFVNILGRGNNKNSSPSLTKVVQNISQILPAFDTLPGVQSIRNQQPNQRPTNNLPPGFGFNSGIYTPNRPSSGGGGGYPSVLNFNPNPQMPIWSTNNPDASDEHDNNDIDAGDNQLTSTSTTSRTRLTPINVNANNNSHKNSLARPPLGSGGNNNGNNNNSHNGLADDEKAGNGASVTPKNATAAYSIRATMIPVVITVCGLFVAAVGIFGFLYRKRLCAISKTLKKKSKEEMAKKSNQSNLSSNLTDDSRNSMVLQHWNGPTAYGNRYVPWEREQQLQMQHNMTTSQLSTSVANGVSHPGEAASAAGMLGGGVPNGAIGIGGVNVGAHNGGGANNNAGAGAANSTSATNSQGKYDRWEFPRHRLKFFNILGEGAFGQVWRCEAIDIDGVEGVSTVAVKTLKENAAEIEKKDLMSELEVMKSLEPHVNVVRFLGCCTDKDPIFVIIEYVNRGKLQTYLRNSRAERHYGNTHGKSNILTSGDLTSFMYQVAKGMDYLTSRGIIHRDLAARNILITDDHTCKVADFGFARDVITSKIYERKSEGKLPIRWMAIESLYDNIFSVKSDIWSFGILMWEIVTLGSTPYPGISAADVMRKVRDGYRLEKPEHCRRELYNIMYYCWSSDPNERPIFSEIVQMLDKLLHTEMDYIELERFPDHNYYNILNPSGEKV